MTKLAKPSNTAGSTAASRALRRRERRLRLCVRSGPLYNRGKAIPKRRISFVAGDSYYIVAKRQVLDESAAGDLMRVLSLKGTVVNDGGVECYSTSAPRLLVPEGGILYKKSDGATEAGDVCRNAEDLYVSVDQQKFSSPGFDGIGIYVEVPGFLVNSWRVTFISNMGRHLRKKN